MTANSRSVRSKKHHPAASRRPVPHKPTSELVLSVYRNAKWATIGLAAALFLAPFATGYTGAAAALWTSLALAVVIGGLGYWRQYRWATLAGAVAVIAPWLLGFSGVTLALCSCVLVGAAVVIVDGYAGFLVDSADQSRAPQKRGSKA